MNRLNYASNMAINLDNIKDTCTNVHVINKYVTSDIISAANSAREIRIYFSIKPRN